MQQLAQMSSPGLGESAVIFLIFGIVVAVLIVPTIFYLLTIQKALSRCSVESRTLSPGLVWLQLIPLFNLVWVFIVVINVSKSLGNEFRRRGISESPNPGQGIGVAMAICSVLSIIPLVGYLTSVASLVLWIVYWVTIAGHSSRIAAPVPATYGP